MAAVIADVFGHIIKSLGKINNTAVSVPPVDKIVDDTVLVAFTNQIITDNNLLVVYRKFFERNDFVPRRFNDFVTHFRINFCGKVLQKSLVFVLV